MLTDRQLLRYSRQILLSGFDIAGQEKVQAARVLIVGLGGLGSPAALYLAAAGVGSMTLADGDEIELSNLQRQIAHEEADTGHNKARSVAARIAALNSGVEVTVVPRKLDASAMVELCANADLALDCSDNYPARYHLNRACIAAGIPMVCAAAVGGEGQLAVLDPHKGGACYRCLYPREGGDTALSCSESGVLAPVVGVFGSLQAMEALKLISGYGEPLREALLVMDLASMVVQRLKISPRGDCPDCAGLRT